MTTEERDALEAPIGGVDVLRWLLAEAPERFAAWKTARGGDDAGLFGRLCAELRALWDNRPRFQVLEESSLGQPVVVYIGGDGKEWAEVGSSGSGRITLEDGRSLPVITPDELETLAADPTRAPEHLRLLLAVRRILPGATLENAGQHVQGELLGRRGERPHPIPEDEPENG